MSEWLIKILECVPVEKHWSTKRRMAILMRWPMSRQLEAHYDSAENKHENMQLMKSEIAEIKAAIPKA